MLEKFVGELVGGMGDLSDYSVYSISRFCQDLGKIGDVQKSLLVGWWSSLGRWVVCLIIVTALGPGLMKSQMKVPG